MIALPKGQEIMQSRLTNSRVALVCLAILISFAGLYLSFAQRTLIILLNSLFVGAMVSIGVTYYKLLWDAWTNPDDFNRVRQMTLTIGGQWLVISLFIATSVYANAADYPSTAYITGAFGRYLATIVAIFQVTAPDYGDGLFYGADRKLLGLGLLAGALCAVIVIAIQGG